MEGDIQKILLREEYKSRINKVQDYIEENIGKELTLEMLSRVANFSIYHFHRIFSSMTGEPMFKYIQRVRLEKAAVSLVSNPKKSAAQIALECGFSNQASFARAFKKHFNMSASQLRADPCALKSKDCKVESKQGKDPSEVFLYNDIVREKNKWRDNTMPNIEFSVELKEMQDMPVVYIRHTGPYKGDAELFGRLFGKLYNWAGARGLIKFPETQMLTVYHDSPEITDEDKLRISVCITAPADTPVDGEVGKMTIQGGKYAVGHFELNTDQYQEAWDSIYGKWLPESGYQPDDGPCFELYLNNPEEHPEKKHIVDIYVPVKPL